MIDSMNPRILANNIRMLFKKVNSITPGTVVEGNPSGSGFNTLLTKIKIGSSKYKLPDNVIANPEGDATGSLSKLQIGSDILSVGGYIDYSTDEHEIGTWLGVIPLYEKIINIENLPNNTTKTVAHDISNLGDVISLSGIASDGVGNFLPLPYINSGNTSGNCQASVSGANISLKTGTDLSSYSGYITLRYTKTTEPSE